MRSVIGDNRINEKIDVFGLPFCFVSLTLGWLAMARTTGRCGERGEDLRRDGMFVLGDREIENEEGPRRTTEQKCTQEDVSCRWRGRREAEEEEEECKEVEDAAIAGRRIRKRVRRRGREYVSAR
mgnify:CR=1